MRKIVFFIAFSFVCFSQTKGEDWVKKGFLYYKRGDFETAISCYKRAVEAEPNLSFAWYWYGYAYFRYGMMAHAKEAWIRYLELCDDPFIRDKLKRYWQKARDGYTKVFTIKGEIKSPARFSHPKGIFIDKSDNLYVTGYGNDVLLKLSPWGRLILKIPVKKPAGVCVDKDGNIYVTSQEENCVLKFSKTGTLTLRFGKKGGKEGEFIAPFGITTDDFGNIYVVDAKGVQKFSKDGKFILKFGDFDKLFAPCNIAIDSDSSIWVADSYGIKQFSCSGNFLGSKTLPNTNWVYVKEKKFYIAVDNGVFAGENYIKIPFSPSSLCVNSFGFVYVADSEASCIEVFSPLSIIDNLDVIINRIDLEHYPTVSCLITLKTQKSDIPSLSSENFRLIEENRVVYPLGVGEIEKDNMGLIFVIEDSKNIKNRNIKKMLFDVIRQFKDGVQGAGVISFSKSSEILSPFTLNKTQIREKIESIKFDKEVSEDGILTGINKAIKSSLGLCAKRAIILFTSSSLKEGEELERIINYARNNNIPIFVVDYKIEKDPILEKLASETFGKYLLARKEEGLSDLYNFIFQAISGQSQYILYYHSPNSSLKWSNEWIFTTIEAGCGQFGVKEKISYLVPEGAGAKSSLGKQLIERKLYLEELQRRKKIELELEEKRKRIKELLEAEKAKYKEEKKEEPHKEKEEKEEKKEHH